MTIVDVTLVGQAQDRTEDGLAQRIADAVGRALGAAPGSVWVRLAVLPRIQYAENGTTQDESLAPAFVTLTCATPPEGPARAAQVAALTDVLAAATLRPRDQVHLEYAPAAVGRMAFGGRLVDR